MVIKSVLQTSKKYYFIQSFAYLIERAMSLVMIEMAPLIYPSSLGCQTPVDRIAKLSFYDLEQTQFFFYRDQLVLF